MNNIETMKLALEALLEDRAWLESDAPKEAWDKNNQAITSLRQAIEQTQQAEPVAWVSTEELLIMKGNALAGAKDWRINVGLVKQDGDVGLYTSPTPRQPLTDEEIVLIVAECSASHQHTDIHFARAIEAKLKEKNT